MARSRRRNTLLFATCSWLSHSDHHDCTATRGWKKNDKAGRGAIPSVSSHAGGTDGNTHTWAVKRANYELLFPVRRDCWYPEQKTQLTPPCKFHISNKAFSAFVFSRFYFYFFFGLADEFTLVEAIRTVCRSLSLPLPLRLPHAHKEIFMSVTLGCPQSCCRALFLHVH